MSKPVLALADKDEIQEIWIDLNSRTPSSQTARWGRSPVGAKDHRKITPFETDPDCMSDGCSFRGMSIIRGHG